MNLKGERVASDMQRELGNILLLEAKDEDFKHVTITDCDVTNDLSFAKIYFTTTDDREKVEKDLNNENLYFFYHSFLHCFNSLSYYWKKAEMRR